MAKSKRIEALARAVRDAHGYGVEVVWAPLGDTSDGAVRVRSKRGGEVLAIGATEDEALERAARTLLGHHQDEAGKHQAIAGDHLDLASSLKAALALEQAP